jgi:hypothetical protein
MQSIRRELIDNVVRDEQYDADKINRLIANKYKDEEEMYDMIVDFLILCAKKLVRIQGEIENRIDKCILVQRQPNCRTTNGIIRMANGMAYSIDPYGENIKDYGRYSDCHIYTPIRVRKDLSEMETDYKESYYILKNMLNTIAKAYGSEPRFVEYIVTENGEVWLIQNRCKWRKDKTTTLTLFDPLVK